MVLPQSSTNKLIYDKQNEQVQQSIEEKHEEQKEKVTERTIKAPQTNTIAQILMTNNISLTSKSTSFAGRKAEDAKVETKKKMVVR